MDIIQNNQVWDVYPTYKAYQRVATTGLDVHVIIIIINSDYIVHDPNKNHITNIEVLNKVIRTLPVCDKVLVHNAVKNRGQFWERKYEQVKNEPSERSTQIALVKKALLGLLII